MYIRTLNYVDWDKYSQCDISTIAFTMDFEINAGFSLCTAISNRMIKKGMRSVEVKKAMEKANVKLKLDYQLKSLEIRVKEISIEDISSEPYEITDRYFVSVSFTIINSKNKTLNEILKESGYFNEAIGGEDFSSSLFPVLLGDKSQRLMNEIISFIEISGFYARQVVSTLNLYLTDEKGQYRRVTQIGGGHQSASQNPIHPLLIKSKYIISSYENSASLPDNIKKHYKKGVHYQFLGFYDESFLCFYKIIESIFKSDNFSKSLSKKIFKTNSKEIIGALKSSNQKTMMLYIYQYFIEINKEPISNEKKDELLGDMLLASNIRNNIAHSSEQLEESKRVLPFLISLANFMIATRNDTP